MKTEDITVVSARQTGKLQETGYLIIPEALYNGVDNFLLEYVCSKIVEAAPKDWKVRIVDESIRATINGAPPYSLYNILETIPISMECTTIKKDEDTYIEITTKEPDQEQVVESFYTRIGHRSHKTHGPDGLGRSSR